MLNRRHLLVAPLAVMATRVFAAGPVARRLDVRDDGLVARFHATDEARGRPAVVMLNGSDGGLPSAADADDLAAAGYPTLSLAYFKDWRGQPDGLPESLNDIPLEYLLRGLDWLARRPEVDRRRIVVMGQSRGAELALLLGTLRPALAGVIAYAPSAWVWGGVPDRPGAPQTRAAWTLGGRPLPFRDSGADPSVPMREWFLRAKPLAAARIPVERIRGRVLLVSGLDDRVWPSDVFADQVAAKLPANRVTSLKFADAGHLLMGTGPGMTRLTFPGGGSFDFGGTPDATARARAEAWAASKALLSSL